MFEGELFGVLKKTKTTGPSRRVRELPIHICRSAFIRFASWLKIGFDIWQEIAPFERDFFLPRSTADGEEATTRMAEFSDAAASGLETLAMLRLPGSHKLLLDPNWCSFFTEHSERPTMVTALVVLQHSKEERDIVGRWKPEGSDVYVRTYHAVVSRLQTRVAEVMRSPDRFEKLQEKEVAQSFRVWCRDRHQQTPEEADSMAGDFLDVLKAPPQGTVNLEEMESQPTQLDPLVSEVLSCHSDSSEEVNPAEYFLTTSRPVNSFIVVKDKKGRGRLRRADGCWMARYRPIKFPTLCSVEPETDSYDFRCRLCWPVGLPVDNRSSEESEAEAVVTSIFQAPMEGQGETFVESTQAIDGFEDQSNWSVTGDLPDTDS